MLYNGIVLVVPTVEIEKLIDSKEGLIELKPSDIRIVIDEYGDFMLREKAEKDEEFRQVIPYVLMENVNGEYLLLKRLVTQGESRLHNKYSLGIGGHVEIEDRVNDGRLWDTFLTGMRREIEEEVDVNFLQTPRFIGLINNTAEEVGRVHIGLFYEVKIKFNFLRETDEFEYSWESTDSLRKYEHLMEGWSKIVLNYLIKQTIT